MRYKFQQDAFNSMMSAEAAAAAWPIPMERTRNQRPIFQVQPSCPPNMLSDVVAIWMFLTTTTTI